MFEDSFLFAWFSPSLTFSDLLFEVRFPGLDKAVRDYGSNRGIVLVSLVNLFNFFTNMISQPVFLDKPVNLVISQRRCGMSQNQT